MRLRLIIAMLTLLVASEPAWLAIQPATAQSGGASLKISPNTGVFEVGSLVDISFLLDTGGDSINAVNAEVRFPADKLQVVNPAASTSFITIWVTAPTFSNVNGTLQFQGGLPNPGIKTSGGVISTVTFRVKSAGRAVLTYAPASQVLRNDGEGTNILSSTGSADFMLKNAPPAGPVVTSPSHPDSNLWYNNPTVQFAWQSPDNVTGYSYSFDQNPKSVPDETPETTGTTTSLKAESDGIWYFHLRAKTETWGGTTTYTVQIDSTPPAAFTPELDQEILTIEEIGILRFLTTDSASGIDHYEVKQIATSGEQGQEGLYVETTSPYTIQPLPAGSYRYVVRAIDRAGNQTEGTIDLEVVAGGLPFFARVPLLRNPAVANGVLIGLGALLLALSGWVVLRRLRIRTVFQHDLKALEHDAQKKAAALQEELDEIRKAEKMIHENIGHDPRTMPPTQTPTSTKP